MSKKRTSRRGKNFQAIPVDVSVALSTLGNGTVIAANLLAALAENYYAISADLQWTIHDLTATEVPIEVGVSHGDLSVTEVGECLDVSFTDPGDIIARERARRPVRRAGVFSGNDSNQSLSDGNPIRSTIKFMVNEGKSLDMG